MALKVVALAGGVGGAKLAHGLAMALPAVSLTIIVNTGDDFHHLGLRICPDLDTVCYTLAGLASSLTGWGRMDENYLMMENLERLHGPTWFRLGDQDLATHLERTRRLALGELLSSITRDFCAAWGIPQTVIPMTDDPVATWVETREAGWLPFQEYFVHQQCEPSVIGFRFDGAESARPAPGIIEAVQAADWVILCPSNPWVSIAPILSVKLIREALEGKRVAAVSPIIGGRAIKGPAAKMYQELGIEPSSFAVASHYHPLLSAFIMDQVDQAEVDRVSELDINVLVTNTIMKTVEDRQNLAEEVLRSCSKWMGGNGFL